MTPTVVIGHIVEKWRTRMSIATSSVVVKRRAPTKAFVRYLPPSLPPGGRYGRGKRIRRLCPTHIYASAGCHCSAKAGNNDLRPPISSLDIGFFFEKSPGHTSYCGQGSQGEQTRCESPAATKDAFNITARLALRIRLSIFKNGAHTRFA